MYVVHLIKGFWFFLVVNTVLEAMDIFWKFLLSPPGFLFIFHL